MSTICFSLLPAFTPILIKFGPEIWDWMTQQYEALSDWLESTLEPLSGIRSIIFGLAGLTSVFFLMWFTVSYNKLQSDWFGIPVWLYAIVISIAVVVKLVSTKWFANRKKVTKWIHMGLLGSFLIFSTGLGLFFMEGESHMELSYSETRGSRVISNIYYYSSQYQSSSTTTDTDTDSDENASDGIGIIIAVGLIIVFLSAFVPHFWFFGGVVIISMMCVVILRELLRQAQYGFDWGFQ